MQRQYQVCPSGLLDGMAVAFAKEVLRALQDALPFHEALLAEHAEETTHKCLPTKGYAAYTLTPLDMAKRTVGRLCLAGMGAMDHAMRMAGHVLDWRRWLG
jgi:hypothetical protein